MQRTKKILKRLVLVLAIFYIAICVTLYFCQEQLIFVPTRLHKSHKFQFEQSFEERTVITNDGLKLNGVLFKADTTNGLIFLLHGNAGSIETIGGVAATFTDLNYDVFILDYRGYGKSEGEIDGEKDLFSDNQIAYDALKKEYDEQDIIILGYSIGSGFAAKLASTNAPKLLILEAPYYSLSDLMRHKYAIIPTFILKYNLATNEYLTKCKMPIVIFHGTDDQSIYYGSSLKLKEELNDKIQLIPLKGVGHTGISSNEKFQRELKLLLAAE